MTEGALWRPDGSTRAVLHSEKQETLQQRRLDKRLLGASGGPRHVGLLSAHLVGQNKYRSRHCPGFGDALSVLVERAHPVEWCRPRGARLEGRGSAEVRYFQRLEKATPANHRAPTSVCITLTKTTCPALNIEARKENRPRVVVSICTAPPQPVRRDFAIAIWSRENRTVNCFGILNAVQKRHASETTEAVLANGIRLLEIRSRKAQRIMSHDRNGTARLENGRQNGIETDRREVDRSLEAALPSPCADDARDAVDAVHLKTPPEPPTTDITTPDYYRNCPLTKFFFSLFQAH